MTKSKPTCVECSKVLTALCPHMGNRSITYCNDFRYADYNNNVEHLNIKVTEGVGEVTISHRPVSEIIELTMTVKDDADIEDCLYEFVRFVFRIKGIDAIEIFYEKKEDGYYEMSVVTPKVEGGKNTLKIIADWHREPDHVVVFDYGAEEWGVMFKYVFGLKRIRVFVSKRRIESLHGVTEDFPIIAEKFYHEHAEKIREAIGNAYYPDGYGDGSPEEVNFRLYPFHGGYAFENGS